MKLQTVSKIGYLVALLFIGVQGYAQANKISNYRDNQLASHAVNLNEQSSLSQKYNQSSNVKTEKDWSVMWFFNAPHGYLIT